MEFNIQGVYVIRHILLHIDYGGSITWKWFDRVTFLYVFLTAVLSNVKFYTQPKFHISYLDRYITYYFRIAHVKIVCLFTIIVTCHIQLYAIHSCISILFFYLMRFLYLNFTDIIISLTILRLKKVWKFYFSTWDIFSCFPGYLTDDFLLLSNWIIIIIFLLTTTMS